MDGSGLSGVEEEVEGGGTGAGAGAVEAEAAGASGREERGNDIVCRCEGGKHALWVIEGWGKGCGGKEIEVEERLRLGCI